MKLILSDKKLVVFNREVNSKSVRELIENVLEKDKYKGDIYLLITSCGGDSSQCLLAYSVLKNSLKNKLITIASGEVASAATIIYLAGHERLVYKNASFYIHAGKFSGDFAMQEARSMHQSFENGVEHFVEVYEKNSNLPKEECKNVIQNSIVYKAEDMIKNGLAHHMIDD